MTLTNDEKGYLISQIKDYIQRRVSKREAKYALLQKGFREPAIDKYWSLLKSTGKKGSWKCSECGYELPKESDLLKVCPSCGALGEFVRDVEWF